MTLVFRTEPSRTDTDFQAWEFSISSSRQCQRPILVPVRRAVTQAAPEILASQCFMMAAPQLQKMSCSGRKTVELRSLWLSHRQDEALNRVSAPRTFLLAFPLGKSLWSDAAPEWETIGFLLSAWLLPEVPFVSPSPDWLLDKILMPTLCVCELQSLPEQGLVSVPRLQLSSGSAAGPRAPPSAPLCAAANSTLTLHGSHLQGVPGQA